MTLIIQTPNSNSLLIELNRAAQRAAEGGAAFAFASKAGISAFFRQRNLQRLVTDGKFDLVVGLDAVTNVEAVFALKAQARESLGLSVFAFLHPRPNSLFHPKFAWFRAKSHTTLIVGSGNLTQAGLGGNSKIDANWEAFSRDKLAGDHAVHLRDTWRNWIKSNEKLGNLRRLDDPEVEAKAVGNGRIQIVRPDIGDVSTTNTIDTTMVSKEETILISELSINRWPQADLGKGALRNFFGFKDDDHREILIQYVNNDNTLRTPEHRQPFKNKSRNYRFELGAGHDLSYVTSKDDDRPIVVFVRLEPRSYRYHILLPTEQAYRGVLQILGRKTNAANRRMRREYIRVDRLLAAWPNIPLQLVPLTDMSPSS